MKGCWGDDVLAWRDVVSHSLDTRMEDVGSATRQFSRVGLFKQTDDSEVDIWPLLRRPTARFGATMTQLSHSVSYVVQE